jgi:stage II sporulation protein D
MPHHVENPLVVVDEHEERVLQHHLVSRSPEPRPHTDGRLPGRRIGAERSGLSAGVRLGVIAAALVVLPLALAACAGGSRPPRVNPAGPAGATPAALRVRGEEGVRSVAVEEYVAGCVLAELGVPRLPAGARRTALAVQAVLCRSYALASLGRHQAAGFDLCGTSHCQVYRPVPDTVSGRDARRAAEDTRGWVLSFDGSAIRPVYHAHCGGRTSAAHDVWAGPAIPWLSSVADAVCQRAPGWTFRVDVARLGRALAADARLALRLPLHGVAVDSQDRAGRAVFVRVQGANAVVVSGDRFRAAVLAVFGARSLRSTRFDVRRAGQLLSFEGRGDGHGVGLCQAGALRLAASGRSPEAILKHYFPGTRLGRVD